MLEENGNLVTGRPVQGCLNTWLKVALWRWQIDAFDEVVTAENEVQLAENGQVQFI